MGKGRSKKKKMPPSSGGPEVPFDNPFAGLKGLRDTLPPGEEPESETGQGSGEEACSEAGEKTGPGARHEPSRRAVVRYQRKGRGGKEVTLVEKLDLPEAALAAWLKALKHQLGCGGAIDGDTLVLQGDQRERLPALLADRGVERVSVS